ncbi:hypothetical protein ACEPAF_1362 [Sanghuangporus sanghuang]
MPTYRRLQQYAIAISIISIIYNGAEGGVSVGLGAESSSRSLVFFGIQSGIEVVSAAVVLWRFRNVAKPGEERDVVLSKGHLRVEKVGTWSIGILIALLALATEITAIVGLARHSEPDSSNASLIISASALVLMILIWLPKRTLAKRLDSSTMEGEATCSLSCIQITIVLFIGSLVFRLWKGGWWVDNATSIVLGLLFAREAWKMLTWVQDPSFNGGCCGGCTHNPPRLDRDAELAEQYRDLCECCHEKDECRSGDACKCETKESEETDTCCVPKTPAGKACCTREIIQGPPPQRVQQSCQDEPVDDDRHDECCSTKNDTKLPESGDRDSCCQSEIINAVPVQPSSIPPAPAEVSTTPEEQPSRSRCQKGCC